MSWSGWRAHFERHALRPLPPLRPDVAEVPEAWRAPLARSLARFQVGESGEGRIAHEIDRAHLPGVDADYRASLRARLRGFRASDDTPAFLETWVPGARSTLRPSTSR